MTGEYNDELLNAYFRGVYFALAALEDRVQAMEKPTKSYLLSTIQEYKELAKSYRTIFSGEK